MNKIMGDVDCRVRNSAVANPNSALEKFCMICTAVPDERTAETIAEKIVENHLAACASIFPVKSVFRWKGKLEHASEFAVVLKTRTALVAECERELKKFHPYELPEIIRIPIGGNREFLKWIGEETAEHSQGRNKYNQGHP